MLTKKLLVIDKITAYCPTEYISQALNQTVTIKWTWKTVRQALKFMKATIFFKFAHAFVFVGGVIYLASFTALFTNMRILKFKSQLTIAFLAAVNHLNGPLRKQNFTLTVSKGQGLWFVIGGFRSVLCVSVFPGSLLVIVIMIDGSEKRIRRLAFKLQNSHVCEKRSKTR